MNPFIINLQKNIHFTSEKALGHWTMLVLFQSCPHLQVSSKLTWTFWKFAKSNWVKVQLGHLTNFAMDAISIQVILCQIYIFCHQLIQTMTTDFVRFTWIVLKFKPCKTCVLNFRKIWVNLLKFDKINYCTGKSFSEAIILASVKVPIL